MVKKYPVTLTGLGHKERGEFVQRLTKKQIARVLSSYSYYILGTGEYEDGSVVIVPKRGCAREITLK